VILLSILLLAAASAPPKPLLCAPECSPVSAGLPAAVAPRGETRTFVWISADRQRAVAGLIPAGASEAALDPAAAVTHRVGIRLSDPGAAPSLRFALVGGGRRWEWSTPKPGAKPLEVVHPAGELQLEVAADGYRKAVKKLANASETIYLYKLPLLRGRVLDAKTQLPLKAVEITALPAGEKIALTDANGKFSAVIGDAWPKLLRVSRPDRAPRLVEVPRTVTDTDLDVVDLSSGGAIHAVLAPPLNGREEVGWMLRRIVGSRDEPVREGRVPLGQTEFTIDRLEAGSYRLAIMGEGPLQRFAVPVRVAEDEVAQSTLRIRPAAIDLHVTFDGAPLSRATVEAMHADAEWHGVVHCDEAGQASEEVWQPGDFFATVSRQPDVIGSTHRLEIAGDGRIRVDLNIPNRRIRGHVVDGKTGAPVAEARVILASRSASGTLNNFRDTAADGAFEFTGIPDGRQTLRVSKRGYPVDRVWQFDLAESDVVHDQDLVINAAEGHVLAVVDARGIPIPSSAVFVAKRGGVVNAGETDGDGRVTVPVDGNEPAILFAVPRSGSFGVLRFPTADPSAAILTLRVPDGSASLGLRTQNDAGQAVSKIVFLLRLDGLLLPAEVLQALANYQGIPLATDGRGELRYPHLPPGHYDVFAVTNREEFQAVYRSSSPPPPTAIVTLVPGEQSLILKLRAKTGG
jgi:Carboxypeptidase regulatory-like domain